MRDARFDRRGRAGRVDTVGGRNVLGEIDSYGKYKHDFLLQSFFNAALDGAEGMGGAAITTPSSAARVATSLVPHTVDTELAGGVPRVWS